MAVTQAGIAQSAPRNRWVNTAAGITAIYAFVGATWIIASDAIVLGRLDAALFYSTFKGLCYVTVTATLLYFLIRASRKALEASQHSLFKSRERLELVVDGAALGTWDWDLTTGRVVLNDHWARMLGYRLADLEPSIQGWEQLVHPDDLAGIRVLIAEHMAGRTDRYETEYRLRHKSGRWVWVRARGKVTERDPGAKPLRMCGTHLDVTEEKRLAERLLQSEKMEAIGRLAGGVAHDFNNLLTVIIGYSELLRSNQTASEDTRSAIEGILEAAERAHDLTTQLLAFSRRQILQPQVLSINEHIEGLQNLLRRLLGEDIELVTSLDPLSGRVRVDQAQLTQVLMNLSVNGRDAMPDGGTLTIGTRPMSIDPSYVTHHPGTSPGEYVQLTVSDTGSGMDEQTLAQLFEPFFTTKVSGQGTGLGLSTVYGIVKQSGGHILAYSEPGHGTTFKVYLPSARDSEEPAPKPAPVTSVRGDETVLVVEDSREIRQVMNEALASHGYHVLLAEGADEALLLAQTGEQIAILVTDVVMPTTNGRQLAERLLAIRPGLRVLYISGYTGDVIAHRGILDAGTDFLQKPFSPATLLARVREILDRPPTGS